MNRNSFPPRILALVALLPLVSVAPGSLTVASPATGPLKVDLGQVLTAAQGGSFTLTLGGVPYVFDVAPNPIAEGAIVGVDGVPVGTVSQTVTFGGTANGAPVRLGVTQAGLFMVVFERDPLFVEPLWLSRPGAGVDLHRVGRWSQETPTIPPHPEPPNLQGGDLGDPGLATGTEGPPAPADRVVRFLVESDFEFNRLFSLVNQCQPCWPQVQQAIMNIAEFPFERQAGVTFQITSQWTCANIAACPYRDLQADLSVWLEAFRDKWQATTSEPAHDLGHLLVGEDLPGIVGVAYEGVVGSSDGYAASEFLSSQDGNTLFSYTVATHEIGHNFNATHGRAAPVPPSLNALPPQAEGHVWTLMKPGHVVQFEFSDGTHDETLNNLARIVDHALDRLDP